MTGRFSSQRASHTENVSIWWRHHDVCLYVYFSDASRTSLSWHQGTVPKPVAPYWRYKEFIWTSAPLLSWSGTNHAQSTNSKALVSIWSTLQWRHNERDGVSNHRRLYCLLNCWFRCRSKGTSKLRVAGLCAGNSSVTGEFPAQKANNAGNISIWLCHHEYFNSLWSEFNFTKEVVPSLSKPSLMPVVV